jgi:hypothetical protein
MSSPPQTLVKCCICSQESELHQGKCANTCSYRELNRHCLKCHHKVPPQEGPSNKCCQCSTITYSTDSPVLCQRIGCGHGECRMCTHDPPRIPSCEPSEATETSGGPVRRPRRWLSPLSRKRSVER